MTEAARPASPLPGRAEWNVTCATRPSREGFKSHQEPRSASTPILSRPRREGSRKADTPRRAVAPQAGGESPASPHTHSPPTAPTSHAYGRRRLFAGRPLVGVPAHVHLATRIRPPTTSAHDLCYFRTPMSKMAATNWPRVLDVTLSLMTLQARSFTSLPAWQHNGPSGRHPTLRWRGGVPALASLHVSARNPEPPCSGIPRGPPRPSPPRPGFEVVSNEGNQRLPDQARGFLASAPRIRSSPPGPSRDGLIRAATPG